MTHVISEHKHSFLQRNCSLCNVMHLDVGGHRASSDGIGVMVSKTSSRGKFTNSGGLREIAPRFPQKSDVHVTCSVVYIVIGKCVPRLTMGTSGMVQFSHGEL